MVTNTTSSLKSIFWPFSEEVPLILQLTGLKMHLKIAKTAYLQTCLTQI